jgi:hypothetical protein
MELTIYSSRVRSSDLLGVSPGTQLYPIHRAAFFGRPENDREGPLLLTKRDSPSFKYCRASTFRSSRVAFDLAVRQDFRFNQFDVGTLKIVADILCNILQRVMDERLVCSCIAREANLLLRYNRSEREASGQGSEEMIVRTQG